MTLFLHLLCSGESSFNKEDEKEARMRAVVQRVSAASVSIDGEKVAEIDRGMLVLLAAAHGDGPEQIRWMAEKLVGLRIFSDDAGKMNLSLEQVRGEMLVVSQFTLYGDCRKGKRPSYTGSARPEEAVAIYRSFIDAVTKLNIPVSEGVFGAMMQVHLINDGPVTLIVDSP
jgi:D-aminoacyl-tRNA deacylase